MYVYQASDAVATPKEAFNKAYTPCVYGTRGKPYIHVSAGVSNEVLNKEINTGNQTVEEVLDLIALWVLKAEDKHSKAKPISIAEKPLKRCTAPGDIILDMFSQQGQMIIAGEQLQRKVYSIVADPTECDVIVNRWEEFTNLKAKIIK